MEALGVSDSIATAEHAVTKVDEVVSKILSWKCDASGVQSCWASCLEVLNGLNTQMETVRMLWDCLATQDDCNDEQTQQDKVALKNKKDKLTRKFARILADSVAKLVANYLAVDQTPRICNGSEFQAGSCAFELPHRIVSV